MKWPLIREYPSEIVLNGHVWRVGFYRKCPVPEPAHEEYWGLCRVARRLILVKLGDTPKGRCETFVHELLHAIGAAYDIAALKDHSVIHLIEAPLARFLVDTGLFYALARSQGPDQKSRPKSPTRRPAPKEP